MVGEVGDFGRRIIIHTLFFFGVIIFGFWVFFLFQTVYGNTDAKAKRLGTWVRNGGKRWGFVLGTSCRDDSASCLGWAWLSLR